jgi:signal peptidase I
MLPTYSAGDLVVAQGDDATTQGGMPSMIGSVVVYRIPAGLPGEGRLIIHRIVGYDAAAGYTTRGDNNGYDDIWHPTSGDLVGTPVAVVPGMGNAVSFARQPIVAASVSALVSMAWLFWRRRRRPPNDTPISVPGVRHGSDVEYTAA